MKVIIIEDEKAAVRNLKALLQEVKPEVEVEATLDSIAAVLDWFAMHSVPDMIFMDIHLADGSAFEIFGHVDITCPIIFTTAYDEYALRAFKVNSVDYLLKPIGKSDIEKAFHKLEQLHGSEQGKSPDNALLQLIHSLKKQESYKTHFLIPVKGDKLLPISVDMILLFYIQDWYLEPSKQLQTMKNTWRQTFVYQLLLDFNTSNLLFGGSQKSAYLCNAFLPRRILRAFILPSRGQS